MRGREAIQALPKFQQPTSAVFAESWAALFIAAIV
jgi:hypothetical protein